MCLKHMTLPSAIKSKTIKSFVEERKQDVLIYEVRLKTLILKLFRDMIFILCFKYYFLYMFTIPVSWFQHD